MLRLIASLLFLSCAGAAHAIATDPARRRLQDRSFPFQPGLVAQSLGPVAPARFTGVYARLDWKPEKPEQSALTVTIDPLSVRTDFPWAEMGDFDAEIGGGENFLDAQPMTFVSQSIRVTGPNTGVVEGLLTILGQTHPARLDVTFNGSMAEHPMMGVAKIGFSATGVIRRSDWGLDYGIPELGDEVTFSVETQMVPADFVFP
ncbi:YceI family protein [Gemmobacter lanyuensis]|uniref:YceI family protein n=1 Tax=Gemmobacter lanyuensis TaxID=1054497 RepID=UPI00360B9D86